MKFKDWLDEHFDEAFTMVINGYVITIGDAQIDGIKGAYDERF